VSQGGELDVAISEAGEPVAKVAPLRPKARRTGRGSLRGRIQPADDFDDLPDDVADAFGTRNPSGKAVKEDPQGR